MKVSTSVGRIIGIQCQYALVSPSFFLYQYWQHYIKMTTVSNQSKAIPTFQNFRVNFIFLYLAGSPMF